MRADLALPPLPATFSATRDAFHRLAVYVVAPARLHATGNEIALAATPGGFGTPTGDGWGQIRVEGSDLVVVRNGGERRAPIRTLREAAAHVGIELDRVSRVGTNAPALGDVDRDLAIDRGAADALAVWFALAWDVVSDLRSRFAASDAPSAPHLWPEHFDVAIDAGDEGRHRRGSWGLSPGDLIHAEPYAYVSLWAGAPDDSFWSERAFAGVSIGYADVRAAGDARGRLRTFFADAVSGLDRPG